MAGGIKKDAPQKIGCVGNVRECKLAFYPKVPYRLNLEN
jgi:hypothetical protein